MAHKSLGRGLSAFLNTEIDLDKNNGNSVVKIELEKIKANPYQPRQVFDENQLKALSVSIKRKGVFQPILVQKLSNDNYQLIAGERRMRASKLAGLKEIPAIITDFTPEEQLEIAIVENVQRENLNPIEEAEGYKRLMNEFNHTQEQLAEIIGKSRSHIANILRLLSLPDDVKQMIQNGEISFGHARALITAENTVEMAKKVVEENLNVRDTEELVKRAKEPKEAKEQKKSKDLAYVDPDVVNISKQIEELSGLKAHLKLKGSKGKIELNFENLAQLDSFIQKMNR